MTLLRFCDMCNDGIREEYVKVDIWRKNPDDGLERQFECCYECLGKILRIKKSPLDVFL